MKSVFCHKLATGQRRKTVRFAEGRQRRGGGHSVVQDFTQAREGLASQPPKKT